MGKIMSSDWLDAFVVRQHADTCGGGVSLVAVILLDWNGVDVTPKSTPYGE